MRSLFLIFILTLSTLLHSKQYQQEWIGVASFYANKFNGRKTANGEVFNNNAMTAANNFLPLGSTVRVTNLRNKKSVVVRITDRLNHKNKRLIDLSYAAAKKLGFIKRGTCRVKMELISKKSKKHTGNLDSEVDSSGKY